MFEKEVMVSSLRKQSDDLKCLVQQIENQPRHSWQDTQCYHEALKKIEASLKKIRKMDEHEAENASRSDRMRYVAYPLRFRDSW